MIPEAREKNRPRKPKNKMVENKKKTDRGKQLPFLLSVANLSDLGVGKRKSSPNSSIFACSKPVPT
jgi:hypothetical protein